MRIFGSKREKLVGGWRKLYNEGLRDLYDSPNIIRAIKSMMSWECSTHGRYEKCIQNVGGKSKDHTGKLGVDERIILESILGT